MESSGSLRLSAEVLEAMDCYLIRPHFDLVPLRPVTRTNLWGGLSSVAVMATGEERVITIELRAGPSCCSVACFPAVR